MLYIACPASHATGGTELSRQFRRVDEDIPIPDTYQFSDPLTQLPLIAETLASCIHSDAQRVREFETYVNAIVAAKSRFSAEVKAALRVLGVLPSSRFTQPVA